MASPGTVVGVVVAGTVVLVVEAWSSWWSSRGREPWSAVGGTVVSGTVVSTGTLVVLSPGSTPVPQATRAMARATAAVSRTTVRNVVLKTM
jgi:hypothetical protein